MTAFVQLLESIARSSISKVTEILNDPNIDIK